MAFVTATPLTRLLKPRTHLPSLRMSQTRPTPPKDFAPPEPRKFYIRPDKAFDIVTGSLGQAFRVYSGALIEGYRVKNKNGRFVEYSSTLPNTKPRLPIRLFEFEACPYCRRVREAVSMLDLDVLFFPCPKGGTVYREYVKEKGGKAQFPYIEDPNTDYESYESDDIIRYLYKTYGPSSGGIPPILSGALTVSAGISSAFRAGKGQNRVAKIVPAAQPIEFWGYEASPFVRLVRETLTDLELPYFLHTTTRGSPTRQTMKDDIGRMQVPYINDPNTGICMFESAEICEYLRATYGPSAIGAVETPPDGSMFMPGMEMGAVEVPAKSLDPQQGVDEVLEEYCEDNPDEGECRVYED